MFYDFAVFVLALVFLVKSGEWVLDSTIKLAARYGIADLAAGYVLIAFSTSLPDFIVSVTASSAGKSAIALGDVLGSSVANICLVLGAASLIRRIDVKREQTLESAELLLIVSLIPLALISFGTIGLREGLLLLLVFGLYVVFVLKKKFTLSVSKEPRQPVARNALEFLAGLAILLVSAHYVVTSGVAIARELQVSEALIGMTFIAFGTTLPELTVDFAALRKGRAALAIGDILGSCVINLTLVIGTSAILSPISNGTGVFTSATVFLAGSAVFLWYVLMRHEGISSKHGLIFLLAYIVFLLVELAIGLLKL